MDKKKIAEFKVKLEEERTLVEKELRSVGIQDPDNPANWIADVKDDTRNDFLDLREKTAAESNNQAIVDALEIRLLNINKALKKIEKGTYGICEVSGEVIPKDRLQANPAAITTVEHSS